MLLLIPTAVGKYRNRSREPVYRRRRHDNRRVCAGRRPEQSPWGRNARICKSSLPFLSLSIMTRTQPLTRTASLSKDPGAAPDYAEVLPGVQHGFVVEPGVGLRAPLGGVAGGLPRT